jgi:exonuclease VII large subunit
MLAFRDLLEKAILSLDGVETFGDESLRGERRRIIRVAQDAQEFTHHLEASARRVQRWWRALLNKKREALKPHAAQVIARSLQAAVAKRHARTAIENASHLNDLRGKLQALQSTFANELAQLASKTEAIAASKDLLPPTEQDASEFLHQLKNLQATFHP